MKKTIFIMLLLAAMLPVTAQDTMFLPTTPIPNYWPECRWMRDNPLASHLSVSKWTHDATILEAYRFDNLKDTLRVVGLAGIMDTLLRTIHRENYGEDLQVHMDARVPEYLCLIQAGPDSVGIVKKVCYTDKTPRCRIALRTRIMRDEWPVWQFPGLYEVFFDDTVTMQDSFYVGSTFYNTIYAAQYPLEGRVPPIGTAVYFFNSFGYYEQDSVQVLFLESDSDWFYPPRRSLRIPTVWPIIDTTGMFADTTVTDTTSISPVADRFTYLMPNPASGQTVLYSSFPMQRVEVYDPAGRCVLRRRVDDRMLRLDLAGYNKGTYLVAVVTPAGRTVKRLVVQ